jgi:hypothetical protein
MKRMNLWQVAALWIGIWAVALMAVFPPWTRSVGSVTSTVSNPTEYALIWRPPTPESARGLKVDYERLALQWIAVVVLTGGALFTFRSGSGHS